VQLEFFCSPFVPSLFHPDFVGWILAAQKCFDGLSTSETPHRSAAQLSGLVDSPAHLDRVPSEALLFGLTEWQAFKVLKQHLDSETDTMTFESQLLDVRIVMGEGVTSDQAEVFG
jgi:hypothetical protein